MLVAFIALGCETFEEVKDAIDDITNPLVVQGLILGVAEPEDDAIDLSDTDWANGALVKVFLADASEVDDMANAPITGATVQTAAIRAHAARSDSTIGNSIMSGGMGNTELSANETAASHLLACRWRASSITRL